MENIIVDIAAMKSKAENLQNQAADLNAVAKNLEGTNAEMLKIWVDNTASAFNYEMIHNIASLKNAADQARALADLCRFACEEYQKADERILGIL